jgi:hypothetical protein
MRALLRHSELDLESSRRLEAAASLTKANVPCGMAAIASDSFWIPNRVWNDGLEALT